MNRTFDRVLLLRHVGIIVGAAAAYLLQSKGVVGYTAFFLVLVSSVLNLGLSILSRRPSLNTLCLYASPVIGVASWTALIAVTGGVISPFIAGLFLEIILSAMLYRPIGIALVALSAVFALLVQQLARGLNGVGVMLGLQALFLVGMGGLTYLITSRSVREQEEFGHERQRLDHRLKALEEELEGEREVGRLGETVARLAHGLKNAVHSLRGFASLIEPAIGDREGSSAALGGLRRAIDDLEALARITLDQKDENAQPDELASCDPDEIVARAVREVSVSHPAVHWSVESVEPGSSLAIPAHDLLEVLLILMRNAIESMDGRGECQVEMRAVNGEFRMTVRDRGPGIPADALSEIFKPGYTTKPQGSGYGLFIANRILSEHGGRLAASPFSERGAAVELALPLASVRDAR